MNQNFISKVLLSLYKKLPQAIRDNEKRLLKRASFSYSVMHCKNSLEIMEEMIDINCQKKSLINLKVLIDKALKLMIEEDKKLIYYRFIKGMKFVDIAKKLNVSIRQVFRLYDYAVTSFSNQLNYLKYPVERIQQEFGSLPIFRITVSRLSKDYGICANEELKNTENKKAAEFGDKKFNT